MQNLWEGALLELRSYTAMMCQLKCIVALDILPYHAFAMFAVSSGKLNQLDFSKQLNNQRSSKNENHPSTSEVLGHQVLSPVYLSNLASKTNYHPLALALFASCRSFSTPQRRDRFRAEGARKLTNSRMTFFALPLGMDFFFRI